MRSIVDPRLMGALESHFPDRCTVQYLTETVDADGQVVKTWTDRHTDVPCIVMPLKGREIKRAEPDLRRRQHLDRPAGLLPGHRRERPGDRRRHDVRHPARRVSARTMTRLSCEVVR